MSQQRDPVFDIVKAAAIFMVLVWHVEDYAIPGSIAGCAVPLGLKNWLVGCNMPLFFLVSGMFSLRLFQAQDLGKLSTRLVIYLWPMVSINLIGQCLALWLGRDICPANFKVYFLFVGWFFWCLALCNVTSFVAFRIAAVFRLPVLLLLLLCFVCFWSVPLRLYNFVAMVPYFWLGFLLPKVIVGQNWFKLGGVGLLAFYTCACVFGGDFWSNGLSFYTERVGLFGVTAHGLVLMGARYGLGVLGALGIIAVSKIVCDCCGDIPAISAIGRATLGIFFIHAFLIRMFYATGFVVGSVSQRFMLALLVVLLSYLIVKVSHMHWLINGILWNPLLIVKKIRGAS